MKKIALNLHKKAFDGTENVTLFTSIPADEWKDEYLTNGISVNDVQHQAGEKSVILAWSKPFYEAEDSVEIKFSKPKNEIYSDPDVLEKDRQEGTYWGSYVLDIKPEEIIEIIPSGYLVAKGPEGDIEEYLFVGEHYLRNKQLPEDQRIWTEDMQSFSKVKLNLKKAWDNPPRDDATYPGSNVSGPVPYEIPKSPGSKPRRDQRTIEDYHAPSQLDRDPIPGDTQPEQGTDGQSHSGDPEKVDNIYPEPSNWLRPLKGLPFTDEHIIHDFNEDFDTEYYIRQRGLNMRRVKTALNMKKAEITDEDFRVQYEGALEEQTIPEQEKSPAIAFEDIPELAIDLRERPRQYNLEFTPEQLAEAISLMPGYGESSTQAYNQVRTIAAGANTPPGILDQLALNSDPIIRWAVATNPNTSPSTLQQLVNDEDTNVRYGTFLNPNITIEIQKQLAQDPSGFVQISIAENSDTSPEILDILIDSEIAAVRETALRHPNAPRSETAFKPPEAPLFENPGGGPITFLDLGGPTSTVYYENPIFPGARELKEQGVPKGKYPEGYVSFDFGSEGSELAPAEEGKHIAGDLENGLPQFEDNSIHGTIFAAHTLQYVTQQELLAKDVARVAAPGTEVVVEEGIAADTQGNPNLQDAPSIEYYNTLIQMGFQFVSATFINDEPPEGEEDTGGTVVVLRKPTEKQGLNMRRVTKAMLNMCKQKFALNMKKAQQPPRWTNPEFLGGTLYERVKDVLNTYAEQIRKNPELEEHFITETIPEFISRERELLIDAGVTLPIILEAIKEAANLLIEHDKIFLDTLHSEQVATQFYSEGPRQQTSEISTMTTEEARFLNEHTSNEIWDIVRHPETVDTPEGQAARSLIQKGIVASKLNMKKQSNDPLDEIGRIVAQWQQTAEVAGTDAVLDVFSDRTRAYNLVMSDLRGRYPEGIANTIAIGVVDAVPQALQIQGNKLNMKKEAEVNPEYDHGTVQTSEVSGTVTDAIKDIQDSIDKDKLHDGEDEPGWVENGIQKLFHITVLFGVNDNVEDEVKKVFDKYKPVHIETAGIEYFSSAPNYDVAIVRCKSEELTKVHDELKDVLKNKETYPNYKPHITIAYLKKGERLADNAQIIDTSWEIDSLDLSTTDGQLEKISTLAVPIRESLDYPHSWRKRKKKKKEEFDLPEGLPPGIATKLNMRKKKKKKKEVVSPKEKKILQMDSNKLNITKEASILDEPRASLDEAIWNIGEDNLPMLKPNVKIHIVENFLRYIAQFGGYIKPEEFVKNMFYTGSTATYTYADASDIDIHVIVDWIDLAALNPDKARKDPKEMWQELHDIFWWTLNKIKLPGTKHPLTYYVVPPGDEKKLVDQKEEIYDIGHDVFLIPPGEAVDLTEEVIDPALREADEFMERIEQHISDARKGVIDCVLLQEVITSENAADRYMRIAYKIKEIDDHLKELKKEYAMLKKKRQDAFEKGDSLVGGNSNWSMGNIIFKIVERYKYMDILRQIKRITDDMDLGPDQIPDVAKALGLDLNDE